MAYSVSDQVQQLYVGYLGRAADQNGLNFWVNAITTGKSTIQSVALGFTLSPEYQAQYANLQPEQQVARVYQNVLGRAPDQAGLAFWSAALRAGTASADTLLSQMTANMGSIDTLYLQNKITAADAYTTAAGSNYDPVAGAAAIGNTAANAGQTFTLTTSLDTITASGNSAINGTIGTLGTSLPTFTPGDKIVATGLNNTLNIVDQVGGTALPAGATVSGVQTVNLVSSGFGAATGGDSFTGYTGLNTLNVTEVGGTVATTGTTGITAASTTAVNVNDLAQGTGSINVLGGSNVAVTTVGVTTGAVTVGSTTAAPTGTITVTATDAAPGAATVAAGAIQTTGGTTVSVTQNIAAATSTTAAPGAGVANTATGGAITINGTATTTSATVAQTAAVAAVAGATAVVTPVAGVTETAAVTFTAALTAGQSVTVGGLTYTSTAGTTQAQLAGAFASLAAGATTGAGTATGTYSGTLTGFSTGVVTANAITATSATANTNVTDLAVSVGGGAAAGVVTSVESQGSAAIPVSAAVAAVGGIADGAIVINDVNFASTTKAGTITSVSLSNYNAGATINDNNVQNLTLAGTGGAVTVNSNLTTPAVTTLNLTTNAVTAATPGASSLTDAGITTLNVVTGGAAASTLTFNDTALTTLNVSGTQNIALTQNATSLTAINVSGGAGVTATLGTGTTFTSTSTGTDVVTISAAATKAIAGNGTAAEEIVWNGATAPAAATSYLGTATGFKVLGLGANTVGESFDLSKMTGFTGIDVLANANLGTQTVSNVTAGTSLSIDGGYAGTLQYFTSDANGSTDSLALTLGTAATKGAFTVGGLTLGDSQQALDGLANVTATINDSGVGAAGVVTITNLSDTSLTNLTVKGTGGLAIGSLFTDTASALTINGTSSNTAGISFNGITDTSLKTLTLTGTDNITLGTVTEGGKGLVVNGSADNANVSFTLSGASTQTANTVYTDSITLGNGTNSVTDTGAAAGNVVSITVGTGANTIAVGSAATNNITLGAHGAGVVDSVSVLGITGAAPTTIVPTATVTGFNDNGADKIVFAADAGATGPLVTFSAAQITSLLGGTSASLTTIVNALLQNSNAANGPVIAQHGIGEFVYQGNTYVVEQANAGNAAFSAGDTLVQLTGTHTLTAASTAAAGALTLHG